MSVDAERRPDLVEGPQFERRLLLWQRVEKSRNEGTGVKPFELLFSDIETQIRNGSKDPAKELNALEVALSEQEEALKEAKRTARGLGVPNSKNSLDSISVSSGNVSAIRGAGPEPSANGDSGRIGLGSGLGSGLGLGLGLPSDHARVRLFFERKGPDLINQVRIKDPALADQLFG